MPTRVSRREVLSSLVVAGAATAALAIGAEAANPVREEYQELTKIGNELAYIAKRMARLQKNWTPPPDPDKPAFAVLLRKIESELPAVQNVAADLLARLGGPSAAS